MEIVMKRNNINKNSRKKKQFDLKAFQTNKTHNAQ